MGSREIPSSQFFGGSLGPLLPQSFYRRDTLRVAQDLLGKILGVRGDSESAEFTFGRIVETEAYFGNDPASHSARGETPRCSVMFGDPGCAYVYFIYGMYNMLNFVTEPKGKAGAVLIRAVEPLYGMESMASRRRKRRSDLIDLTNGPGKLCEAMGVGLVDNGQSLRGPRLFVFEPQENLHSRRDSRPSISASARVGIRQAVEKPWRFFFTENPFVSRVQQNKQSQIL